MNLINRLRYLFPPSEILDGYGNPELVEVIFQKTKAHRPALVPWSESAETVLDFGGGCGIHYKNAGKRVRWAVVETPAMVARASELATDELKFFSSIRAAADWLGEVDLMHSNSALPYCDEPEMSLKELCKLNAKTMLWRRTFLSKNETETEIQVSRLFENGPGQIGGIANKSVKYRVTRLAERIFLDCHVAYQLAERSGDDFRFVERR